jgi:calcium-dependent protein kinase
MNGAVNKAVRKNAEKSGEVFAVKEFDLSKLSGKAVSQLEGEVQVYLCLDHPHICRLVNVYQTPKSLSLVMECMTGGELFDRITSVRKFPEPQAVQAVQQMLLAVNYLHSHDIVHRDIKLENFVYDEKGSDLLKLIDFGFSKFRERNSKMKTACGTMAYVAPEVLTDSYTSQCDLWSMGVIVFILLSGSMPFHGDSGAIKNKIIEGDFTMKKAKWDPISKEAKEFTRGLLQRDPKVRLTALQALDHPWLQSYTDHGAAKIDKSMIVAFNQYCEAPKFRRCCLLAMARLLTTKDTEKVRQEFFAIDTDRQGTISFKELKAVMVHKFNVPENDVYSIFETMDANHDDEIHYSEFLAAMLSSKIEVNDRLLDSTFRNFDKDLSGFITADNLRDAFGDSFEGKEVEALLKEARPAQDGRISFSEFAAHVRGTPLADKSVQLSYPPGCPPPGLKVGKELKEIEVTGPQQQCCSIM